MCSIMQNEDCDDKRKSWSSVIWMIASCIACLCVVNVISAIVAPLPLDVVYSAAMKMTHSPREALAIRKMSLQSGLTGNSARVEVTDASVPGRYVVVELNRAFHFLPWQWTGEVVDSM